MSINIKGCQKLSSFFVCGAFNPFETARKIGIFNNQPLGPKLRTMKLELRSSTILGLLLSLSYISYSQKITGTIQDNNGTGVPYATVVLLDADSSLVKGEISNGDGIFMISTSKTGTFKLVASSVGYSNYTSESFSLEKGQSKNFGTIKMSEDVEQLEEVVIEAEKPLFEQKIDRTVVNVSQNIGVSGGSALEVLERSPGITVDKMNSSIALAGKQGVRVMINGKISNLPASAVVQMLDGMNAENLEKIELITTPPAKYEAEGDAGMINIVLKKSADKGTNGFISAFAGYGRKEKYGGTININHRNKGFNVYADYGYRNNVTQQVISNERDIQNGSFVDAISAYSNRDASTVVHNGRIGTDVSLGKSTVIGGYFSFFSREWNMDAQNDIQQTFSGVNSSLNMETIELNQWDFTHSNFNISQDITKGHNLSMDFNYISYDANNPTDYNQDFFDDQGEPTGREMLRVGKETPTAIYTAQIDYSANITDDFTLEAGAKTSFTDLENDVTVEETQDGVFVTDDELTNFAMLNEDITAGYASMSWKASDKISLKAGIRYERTQTDIDTKTEENVVDRDFGNFFPSFFYNNTINKDNSWVFSYSRRVSRPRFTDIAPFIIFVDPNAFFAGNEKLLPSLTNNVRFEYRYKTFLISTSYSRDKDAIARFQPELDDQNRLVSTSQNLEYRDNYSVNATIPFGITDWWEVQINLNGSLIKVRSSHFENPVDFSVKNLSTNGTQRFKLPKNMKAEISWFYSTPQFFGVSKIKAVGSINLGLETPVGQNGTLRASMNDIFNMNNWRFRTDIPEENLDVRTLVDFETRVFRISYNQKFGNNKLKGKRRRKSGSDTELQRIQS